MINGTSSLISQFNPAIALQINPLRSDDRVSVSLAKTDDARTGKIVEKGMFLSPIDARFYSLMGVLAERSDDREAASQFYRHALDLLPTELQALSRQLVFDIQSQRYLEAAETLEILGRRWPDRWSSFEPALPILLSDPDANGRITQRFADYPPLRVRLIRSLARTKEMLPFAYRMAVDWHDRGVEDVDSVINLVTNAFLREKRYTEAYLLFQLTRPESTKSAFVYNDTFEMPFSGNAFDWRIRDQAGVSFDRVTQDGDAALSMRFLDNPIRFRNVSQLVRLVPGRYEVAISYESRDLVTPKPIRFAVRCIPSGQMVLSTPFQDATSKHKERHGFTVPATGCALLELHLFNEKMPMSWRNRYRGTLVLRSVSIVQRRGV